MSISGKEYGLALARITAGLNALLHGISDTFGVWTSPRFTQTAGDLAARTDTSADAIFYVVSVGMLVIGLLLTLGAASRAAAAAALALTIWDAIATGSCAHYFVENGGAESLIAHGALFCVVITNGPGALKVDLKRKSKQK